MMENIFLDLIADKPQIKITKTDNTTITLDLCMEETPTPGPLGTIDAYCVTIKRIVDNAPDCEALAFELDSIVFDLETGAELTPETKSRALEIGATIAARCRGELSGQSLVEATRRIFGAKRAAEPIPPLFGPTPVTVSQDVLLDFVGGLDLLL